MADMSVVPSDDEGDEGDDGEDEGDGCEGGEGGEVSQTPGAENDKDQDQDQEMADAEQTEASRPSSTEAPTEAQRAPSLEEDTTVPQPRLPSLDFAPLQAQMHLALPRTEGSPLKNVVIQSPTNLSPMVSPRIVSTVTSDPVAGYMDVPISAPDETGDPGATVIETYASQAIVTAGADDKQFSVTESQFSASLHVPSDLVGNAAASVDLDDSNSRVEEIPFTRAEEQTIPDVSEPANIGPPEHQQPETVEQTVDAPGPILEHGEPQPAVPYGTEGQQPMADEADRPPASPAVLPAPAEDEDDGLNLLGSLERELDRQEGVSSAGGAEEQKTTPSPPAATVGTAADASVVTNGPLVEGATVAVDADQEGTWYPSDTLGGL